MNEVCKFFNISKPAVYDWIKNGILKPLKIQSRVYFLYQDVQLLLKSGAK
ncbi:MAG TPA: helix-turn-helix domain-containing protein [Puia sp.]